MSKRVCRFVALSLTNAPAPQAFVSYKVVSTVGLEGYRAGRHDVIRRFRDFTWLKNRLRSQYKGE